MVIIMADDIQNILNRESKWQKRWHDERVFVPKNDGVKPRFYNLVEFPFLSVTTNTGVSTVIVPELFPLIS